MKTLEFISVSNFEKQNINLAIGNFDGVHLGHQEIIKNLINKSKNINAKSAILSFTPHPREFFTGNNDDFKIIEEEIKINLLKQFKVDYYISYIFDKPLSLLDPEEFIEKILYNQLGIKSITVGYDFKFGKNRKGDTNLLKKLSDKYNYSVFVIEQIKDKKNNLIYSSSLIRDNIKSGNFESVTLLLGRNWTMKGPVIRGDGRARKINFPTANILPKNLIKPKKGVYAIKAIFNNKSYFGIANFGIRPTIKGDNLLLEAHLFDFNEEIYGKELTVEFLKFIRGEKKFNNFSLLVEQIQKDIKLVKDYHRKI